MYVLLSVFTVNKYMWYLCVLLVFNLGADLPRADFFRGPICQGQTFLGGRFAEGRFGKGPIRPAPCVSQKFS